MFIYFILPIGKGFKRVHFQPSTDIRLSFIDIRCGKIGRNFNGVFFVFSLGGVRVGC
jgi:hypothetical protein